MRRCFIFNIYISLNFQTQVENDDSADNTTYDDEEYDFWGGEYDEYSDETEEIVTPAKRINFEKSD